LRLAEVIDLTIGHVCRAAVIVTGVALTVVMTANVLARHLLAQGGFAFAQELPTLLFPWMIVAGVVLAALGGAHMAVDWIYGKVPERLRVPVYLLVQAIVGLSFAWMAWQAVIIAQIAGIQRSPVLHVPGSVGFYSIALGSALIFLVSITASIRVIALGWDARPHPLGTASE